MRLGLLENIVGPEALATEPEELEAHAVDGRAPQASVFPASVDQLAEIIRLANDQGWAVAPFGSGTKIDLGNSPRRLDLVLSTRRLNRVLDLDPDNLTVTAQAGVVLGDLQDLLAGRENRCFFPPDSDLKERADRLCSSRSYKGVRLPLDPPFADRATLGGIVAADSFGPRGHRFGRVRDLLLGLRYVQPTGEIIGMGGKTVKNVSGYDMSKLLIGSLGTLGVIAETTFRLLPLPSVEAGFIAAFDSLVPAAAMARVILDSRLLPSILELIDHRGRLGDLPEGGWRLAVVVEGEPAEITRQLHDLDKLAAAHGAAGIHRLDADCAAGLALGLIDWPRPSQGFEPVRLKGYYPLAAYFQVLQAWSEAAAAEGLGCAIQARVGLGLAFARLDAVPEEAVVRVAGAMRAAAVEAGGGLVVEAAPPHLKNRLDVWGAPRSDFPLMERLKRRFDPKGVLNPGRFVGGL